MVPTFLCSFGSFKIYAFWTRDDGSKTGRRRISHGRMESLVSDQGRRWEDSSLAGVDPLAILTEKPESSTEVENPVGWKGKSVLVNFLSSFCRKFVCQCVTGDVFTSRVCSVNLPRRKDKPNDGPSVLGVPVKPTTGPSLDGDPLVTGTS